MTTKKPTKGAPAKRRGRPSILASGDDRAIAEAFAQVFGGVKGEAAAPRELIGSIDEGWLHRLRMLLAAWLREAAPNNPDALFFCECVDGLLIEHQEQGIKTRDLLLSARRMAGRMNISNMHRYAFVGIVASAATGDAPKRTRKNQASKTPEVIPMAAGQWVHQYLVGEGGRLLTTKDDAIEKARALLADILPDNLVPTKRKVGEYYAQWLAEQPKDVPRVHGNAKPEN
ncbi:hypothetical protein [Pseudoxanthomonas mexicana]